MVSALESRLKKKFQVIFLHSMIKNKDEKMTDFIKMLQGRLKGETKILDDVIHWVKTNWDDEEEPSEESEIEEEIPVVKNKRGRPSKADLKAKEKLPPPVKKKKKKPVKPPKTDFGEIILDKFVTTEKKL